MKIYARAIIRYFVFFSVLCIAFFAVKLFFNGLYSLLATYFPSAFPTYLEYIDGEKYTEWVIQKNFAAALLFLPVPCYLAVVYDNERFEYIISKTDGFFKIFDGVKLYAPRYILPDAVASLIAPMPFYALSFIRFPETTKRRVLIFLKDACESLTELPRAMTDFAGHFIGISILVLLPIVIKQLFKYSALKRWRGIWLSDINNV